jgi:hypothetical protein
MRPIGFSTGALAYGDFRRGLAILGGGHTKVVELSALRENELIPLIAALDSLDLSRFAYISVHAPSRYEPSHERQIIDLLKSVVNRGWAIVLHPDTVHDFAAWAVFRDLLFIENMDKRNQTGRTAQELSAVFAKLPHAGLCFDLGHCRQVDPTMNEACLILSTFGTRLKQLHLSEVNSRSTHDSLSDASIGAFQKISHLIPERVPVILESPVAETEVEAEIERARLALPLAASANGARKRDGVRVQSAMF